MLFELSKLLNTGLDRRSLELMVGLCESGVNPEALAAAVRELRAQARAVRSREPAKPAR